MTNTDILIDKDLLMTARKKAVEAYNKAESSTKQKYIEMILCMISEARGFGFKERASYTAHLKKAYGKKYIEKKARFCEWLQVVYMFYDTEESVIIDTLNKYSLRKLLYSKPSESNGAGKRKEEQSQPTESQSQPADSGSSTNASQPASQPTLNVYNLEEAINKLLAGLQGYQSRIKARDILAKAVASLEESINKQAEKIKKAA